MKRLRITLALGATGVALSFSTTSRADDTSTSTTVAPSSAQGEAPSVGPTEHYPNRRLLWTGVTAFAVTYTASVVGGGVGGDRISDKNLFIPLVGPWLDLGQRDCEFRGCNDKQEVVFKSLIIASGIVQGAGVLVALSSLFIPETTQPVRIQAKTRPDVHVLPVSLSGGAGLGAVGTF